MIGHPLERLIKILRIVRGADFMGHFDEALVALGVGEFGLAF
jgi:hypothetical protein